MLTFDAVNLYFDIIKELTKLLTLTFITSNLSNIDQIIVQQQSNTNQILEKRPSQENKDNYLFNM